MKKIFGIAIVVVLLATAGCAPGESSYVDATNASNTTQFGSVAKTKSDRVMIGFPDGSYIEGTPDSITHTSVGIVNIIMGDTKYTTHYSNVVRIQSNK